MVFWSISLNAMIRQAWTSFCHKGLPLKDPFLFARRSDGTSGPSGVLVKRNLIWLRFTLDGRRPHRLSYSLQVQSNKNHVRPFTCQTSPAHLFPSKPYCTKAYTHACTSLSFKKGAEVLQILIQNCFDQELLLIQNCCRPLCF